MSCGRLETLDVRRKGGAFQVDPGSSPTTFSGVLSRRLDPYPGRRVRQEDPISRDLTRHIVLSGARLLLYLRTRSRVQMSPPYEFLRVGPSPEREAFRTARERRGGQVRHSGCARRSPLDPRRCDVQQRPAPDSPSSPRPAPHWAFSCSPRRGGRVPLHPSLAGRLDDVRKRGRSGRGGCSTRSRTTHLDGFSPRATDPARSLG